jgi:hypothetical protein
MKEKMPQVADNLNDGLWTGEAEKMLLKLYKPGFPILKWRI